MYGQHNKLTRAKWLRIKSCNHQGKVVEAQVLARMEGHLLVHVRSGKGAVGVLRTYEIEQARRFIPGFSIDGGFFTCAVKHCDDKHYRIELGLDNIYSDPVRVAYGATKIGDIVHGVVDALSSAGCFVKLNSGLVGFLHVNQLPHPTEMHDVRIENIVREEDRIQARVIGKDDANHRLELSVTALLHIEETARGKKAEAKGVHTAHTVSVSRGSTITPAIGSASTQRNVLLLEDEPIALDALASIIEAAGHTVFRAATVEEAEDILAKHTVECIVSDILLDDGKDAIDFLIECVKRDADMAVLVTTGYFDLETEESRQSLVN